MIDADLDHHHPHRLSAEIRIDGMTVIDAAFVGGGAEGHIHPGFSSQGFLEIRTKTEILTHETVAVMAIG
jgi:hypothetical protein